MIVTLAEFAAGSLRLTVNWDEQAGEVVGLTLYNDASYPIVAEWTGADALSIARAVEAEIGSGNTEEQAMSAQHHTTEKQTGYTPGPWRASALVSPEEPRRYMSIYDRDETEIAVSSLDCGSCQEAQANGHLIAAAPDLLEACKAFVRDRVTCPIPNGKDLEAWGMMVRAIRKAESHD